MIGPWRWAVKLSGNSWLSSDGRRVHKSERGLFTRREALREAANLEDESLIFCLKKKQRRMILVMQGHSGQHDLVSALQQCLVDVHPSHVVQITVEIVR